MPSPDDLRIGDRERDEVTALLHEAFAQGRLTREELDERLEAALSARTAGELRRVTADLPGADGSASWRGPYHAPAGGPGSAPRPPAPPYVSPQYGPGWEAPPDGRHGDLGTWGWHAAAARRGMARPHRRLGPFPLIPLAILLLIALVSGAWPVFAVLKVMFIVWIIGSVFHLGRRRRDRTRWRGGPYGPRRR
ncbi:DUF1707 domain-containing protein [Microbispora sp. RL4-1S]|uniref:DUF1707 domain-containing protein n=1 Tax=Microbispora oryzae TaxID=2806554 RepID=A0A940WPA9_9ACTN|nr:DUF1707 domain-containing protein [Microbispora oryzae]MBP2707077.1 DUF1707 domain-containing protein [Microbispora oryzae]